MLANDAFTVLLADSFKECGADPFDMVRVQDRGNLAQLQNFA